MQELKWIQCPKSWFKLESEFTTWWLWEWKKKWFWKKKWSDWSREQKPYDCNIRTNLDSYHVEIKIIKKDEFSFDKFQPNQIKALQEISLVDQPYFKEQTMKVGDLLKQQSFNVHSFLRYAVGEGIEKKEDNFAEEVASMTK